MAFGEGILFVIDILSLYFKRNVAARCATISSIVHERSYSGVRRLAGLGGRTLCAADDQLGHR